MIRSTVEEDGAEFHDEEDSAEQTDEGGGGGDGPRLKEDLERMEMTLLMRYCSKRLTRSVDIETWAAQRSAT